MICSNCGYRNQAGDEFCGSCGKFLEWSAVPTEDSPTTVMPPGAPAGGRQPPPEQPINAAPVPPPTTPPPPRATGRHGSTPARPADAADPGPPPRSRDVTCWNCGRRNPATRTFCQQCGERIDSAPAPPVVAAGPAMAATAAADEGGNEGRLVAIGLGLIGLLLLVGLGTFLFLGGLGGPTPTPTGVAVVSPTPTFELPTLPPTPTPTIGEITFPPTESPTLPPTPSPTLPPTPTPTLPPTPTPTLPPTAPPTPTPTPTAAPTPIDCATNPPATHVREIVVGGERRTAPTLAWCINTITFTDGGGEGVLKIYLDNEEFIGPPGNYGMSRIGWVEVDISLFRDSPYAVPDWTYPFPYEYLPPGTLITLEVHSCTLEPCTGMVQFTFARGPIQ